MLVSEHDRFEISRHVWIALLQKNGKNRDMRQGKTIFDHFYYTEKDLETLSEEMGDDLNVVLP